MRDNYSAGQAGAMGANSSAHHNTFNQLWQQAAGEFDLPALADGLSTLRKALRKSAAESDDPEVDRAIVACTDAETAAKKGDGPTMLENLKKLGSAGLAKATEIGANIVASAIAKTLNPGT